MTSYTAVPKYAMNLGMDLTNIEKTTVELLHKLYGFKSDTPFEIRIYGFGRL